MSNGDDSPRRWATLETKSHSRNPSPRSRRPFLWGFHSVLLLMSWWWLLEGSFTFGNLTQFFPLVGLLILLAIWLAIIPEDRHRKHRHVTRFWFWLGPIIGLLVVSVAMSGLPLRLRWELSQDAFEEFVADPSIANHGDGELLYHQPLGRFEMELVHKTGSKILFYERISNGMGSGGILYAPDGLDGDPRTVRHIEGPWYFW